MLPAEVRVGGACSLGSSKTTRGAARSLLCNKSMRVGGLVVLDLTRGESWIQEDYKVEGLVVFSPYGVVWDPGL